MAEKRFVEEFTQNVTEHQKVVSRLRKVELLLELQDKMVLNFFCSFCARVYNTKIGYKTFEEVLHCIECDKLYCYKHPCRHFIKK